jgi:hypothetical protein
MREFIGYVAGLAIRWLVIGLFATLGVGIGARLVLLLY